MDFALSAVLWDVNQVSSDLRTHTLPLSYSNTWILVRGSYLLLHDVGKTVNTAISIKCPKSSLSRLIIILTWQETASIISCHKNFWYYGYHTCFSIHIISGEFFIIEQLLLFVSFLLEVLFFCQIHHDQVLYIIVVNIIICCPSQSPPSVLINFFDNIRSDVIIIVWQHFDAARFLTPFFL